MIKWYTNLVIQKRIVCIDFWWWHTPFILVSRLAKFIPCLLYLEFQNAWFGIDEFISDMCIFIVLLQWLSWSIIWNHCAICNFLLDLVHLTIKIQSVTRKDACNGHTIPFWWPFHVSLYRANPHQPNDSTMIHESEWQAYQLWHVHHRHQNRSWHSIGQ